MNLLPILLTIAVASSSPSIENQNRSEAFLETALSFKKADTKKSPKSISVLLNLRKAWLAAERESATEERFGYIRKEFVAQYKRLNAPELAAWYNSATREQMTKKIRDKENEAQSIFQKDWKVRMDEFDMITIWRPDSIKDRQTAIFRHYKPGDPGYGEVAAEAHLKRQTEKPVDFDLSAFFITNGPSFSMSEPIW